MEYIDFHSWPRKEHFRFFSSLSFPFYGVTLSLDVTNLRSYVKAHGLSFYYALIYATLTAMNGLPDFLYKIRGDRIVRHDRLHPSFVVLDEDTHLIKIVNVPLDGTMEAFCRRAEEQVLTQKEPFPDAQQENRDDLVYISCTPWFSFTSLSNEMDCDPDDSIPRITWGKYEAVSYTHLMPTRRTFQLLLPQGCSFFNSSTSPTRTSMPLPPFHVFSHNAANQFLLL